MQHRIHPEPRRWRLAPLAVLLGLGVLLGSLPASAGPKGKPGVPDRKLQKAIDKAIKTGAAFLRAQQEKNGRIGHVTHCKEDHYTIGSTALAGLALLAAGDKKGDKELDLAMAYCREQDALRKGSGRSTYDTGTLLMFVTEYYRVDGKKKKRKKNRTMTGDEARNPCSMPPEVLEWIKDMAMFLVNTQEESGGFGYPKPREDLSNTQYALLGLRAARECGGKVPRRTFKRVMERMLELQEKEGPKVLRTLGGEKKGEPVYKIDGGDRARGWGYMQSAGDATGSMTTAGIACLSICHDALMKLYPWSEPKPWKQYDVKLRNRVKRSMQDGFAWLDANFTVERNPGRTAPPWHYYYLYGLERAAVFANRDLIGEHDWYILGSRYLVSKQRKDGSWNTGALGGSEYKESAIIDTAWAILFLKKATRPLEPIPQPVVTPAGN